MSVAARSSWACAAIFKWALFLPFAGCAAGSSAEVVGVYTASHGAIKEELTLSSDGSFLQAVRTREGGAKCESAGKWLFHAEDGSVGFDGLLVMWDEDSGLRACPKGTGAVLPTMRIIGTWIEVPDHFCYHRR
jgi:hypothetical protein